MKNLKKLFFFMLAVSFFTMIFAIAVWADPTGSSYIATTGKETLNDVATTANKALLGANYI